MRLRQAKKIFKDIKNCATGSVPKWPGYNKLTLRRVEDRLRKWNRRASTLLPVYMATACVRSWADTVKRCKFKWGTSRKAS